MTHNDIYLYMIKSSVRVLCYLSDNIYKFLHLRASFIFLQIKIIDRNEGLLTSGKNIIRGLSIVQFTYVNE